MASFELFNSVIIGWSAMETKIHTVTDKLLAVYFVIIDKTVLKLYAVAIALDAQMIIFAVYFISCIRFLYFALKSAS